MSTISVLKRRPGKVKCDLRKIPEIGEEMEHSLFRLGFHTIKSLRDANPDQIYEKECLTCGRKLDRSLLYKYRCAVYYANTPNPDPEKLHWAYWRDKLK
jgi:hypothetical protein